MKKYTKKQIREAIAYWERKLDESGLSSGTELAELAKAHRALFDKIMAEN